MPYTGVVVSHTHWDREWYLPFQSFRYRLTKLMDSITELLTESRDYQCFLLDGQTVILEDYLEIKPEATEKIRLLIKQDRLRIGPWYTMPDEFLASSEALIRNITLGEKIGRKFGKILKIGYLPDPFGHISQLPQILRGFDMKSFVFKRGYGEDENRAKTEFLWEAPDGSRVLTIYLMRGYNNAVNLPSNPEEATEYVKGLADFLLPHSPTGDLMLLMDGNDHCFPRPEIVDIIRKVNKRLKEGVLIHGGIDDYVKLVKEKDSPLEVYRGELRSSRYHHLLTGVLSARMYLKQANARAQKLMEHFVEPLSSLAWLLGFEYPTSFIWKAWRLILQNHAHDSICGCSIDEVHDENMVRFRSAEQIAENIIRDKTQEIESMINTMIDEKVFSAVMVYNTLGWRRDEPVELKLEAHEIPEFFKILDPMGNSVAFQVTSLEGKKKVTFIAGGVPPLGYAVYNMVKTDRPEEFKSDLKWGKNTIENSFFGLEVDEANGGSLKILDKNTGRVFEDFNTFESSGDAGDEYNISPPEEDSTVTSRGVHAHVSLTESDAVKATLRVSLSMKLPRALKEDRKSRSDERVDCPIHTYVSMYDRIPRIDVKTIVDNRAKDHRLRVCFPTRIQTEYSHADDHFYVIKRPSRTPPRDDWIEQPSNTHPQSRFVDVNDGSVGVAIANKGLPEYELKNDGDATIALTLLRCVGWLSRGDLSTRIGEAGPMIATPKAQCQGSHTFEYSIIPHAGNWIAGKAYKQALEFDVGSLANMVKLHKGDLPSSFSFLEIEPDHLIVSSVKKAEEESALTIRFYNVTGRSVKGKLRITKSERLREAWIASISEERKRKLKEAVNEVFEIPVEPHKVISILAGTF